MASHTFEGVIDIYNGITVDSRKELCETDQFATQLNDSLKKWTSEGRRCIWFKVDIKEAAWVPILANEGFNFHQSRDGFVRMYKWLPKESSPNLPPACHTNVGVGAMVLNDKNEILVVTENHAKFTHWKLPGGYVERGEDIKDAAVREVKEETGIDAVFESMVTMRHTHNAMFGNSDIYIVVALKATSSEIKKSEEEIQACKWINIDEYLKDPNVHAFNQFIVKQALDLNTRKIKLCLLKNKVTFSTFTRDITSLVIDDL